MTLQNCEIVASVVFLLVAKIISFVGEYYRASMFNKSGSALTSIPENDEEEAKRWVPKKKHEVLKAKYKCLKKLFQIYDASVIGILPEPCETECLEEEEKPRSRRRRSRRTKTDACAGTTEPSSGDVTDLSVTDKASTIATAVMRELKKTQCSYVSTQVGSDDSKSEKSDPPVSRSNLSGKESEGVQVSQVSQHPVPYLIMNERPKLTRFQCFMQRIFGIRQDRPYKSFIHSDGHVYAASDNNITPPYGEKRRRRGLRFRKLRRPRKIQSEGALRSVRSPTILTYVQSVQKNCLMDTTPRQCPIMGCRMIFYGIINYNDHLNLCHFTERKYVCHYCHEGFEQESEKYSHENEHIGITKLNAAPSPWVRQQRKASITQTDPEPRTDLQEDKLKKIVSFFDKIADPERILTEIKKNRYSESNLQSCKEDTATESAVSENSESDKRTVSCVNLPRKGKRGPLSQSQLACHFCGEGFQYRRQLSLHVDLEHRVHDKFSKFHSCTGVCETRRRVPSPEGGGVVQPSEDTLRRRSDESLSYEPSTNIVYYTSAESVPPKCQSPMHYKWEPATKIIRV